MANATNQIVVATPWRSSRKARWSNLAHIGLGWVLGSQWGLVGEYAPMLQYAAIAAMTSGVIFFVWHRRRSLREGRALGRG